jgi:alkaline phosphatase
LGGGKDYLLPRSKQGKRRDGEDLSALLRARGYAVVEDRAGLAAAKSGRVFGAFAMGPMAAEIDRPHTRPQEPNLAEMARKAIELLSSDPDGFFLMIEGSQIDWACHANDPAHLLGDLVMFDEAVNVALDFAKSDGNTLVLAFSDHNTGGMSIGNRATSRTYSQMGVEELIGPFKRMKASAPEMWRKLCAPRDPEEVKPDQVKPQDVQKVVEECWGISLSLNEARHLLQVAGLDSENPHNAFGAVICPKWTNVGFTSHGHTGGDVPLFAFGPGAPVGLLDGPAIGALSASALGLDLEKLNQRLYVDLQREVADARVSVVDSGENKLVVRVLLGDRSAELPVHKNILTIAGKSIELEGLVVYVAETKKAYLPLQAVQLLRGQPVCLPSIARQ